MFVFKNLMNNFFPPLIAKERLLQQKKPLNQLM